VSWSSSRLQAGTSKPSFEGGEPARLRGLDEPQRLGRAAADSRGIGRDARDPAFGIEDKVARAATPSSWSNTPKVCANRRVTSPMSGKLTFPSPCSIQARCAWIESTLAPSSTASASRNFWGSA